jgi:CHASE2 domain-containing sensor protein/class 3 adenylate cyclase
LAVAHVVAAAVLLCRDLAWLQPAELAVYDRLVVSWAGGERSEHILLVTISEMDIGRYGSPLRDEDLTRLLERLTGWGARVIGVDIYRDRPVPPGSAALTDLLTQHPEIVWVFKLPDESTEGVPAPSVLADSSRAVLADVVADASSVVRRGLLAATDMRTDRVVRTLGAAVAEYHTGQLLRVVADDLAIGNGRVALVTDRYGPYAFVDSSGYQMLLDFHGGRDRFQRLSFGEVMENDTAAALVRGRIVLVGTEAPSVKDNFATPFNTGLQGGEPLTGVSVHAHLADQLIRLHDNEAVSRVALPGAVDAIVIWVFSIAAAATGLAFPSVGVAFAAMLVAGLGLTALSAYAAFGTLGLILPAFPVALAWCGSAAGTLWVLHGAGIRERQRLRRSFEHYLDRRIIKDLLDSESLPGFGGEHREISALFTDIAGFTTLAETLPAEKVADLLGDYFDGVCAEILAGGGLVSVFVGDGLLALFGAPHWQDDHADRAVETALRIDNFAQAFAAAQNVAGTAFGITRIGVHSGMALVGNVGTRARLNYGAIGDVVNTASRLEGLNKRIGTRIVVSGETVLRCTRSRFRLVGEFVPRGRREAITIAMPITPSEAADQHRSLRYEAAYAAMRAGHPEAGILFSALHQDDPGDPCVIFHCRRLARGETGVRLATEEPS